MHCAKISTAFDHSQPLFYPFLGQAGSATQQGDVVRSGRWVGDADDVHRRESAAEVRYGYLHNLLLASSPAPTPLICTSLVRAASFGRGQLLTPAPSWTILTPS